MKDKLLQHLGRARGKGCFMKSSKGLLSHGENFYGGRRERSVSRVKRNGFISVNAEVSLCGQLFRGRWSAVNLKQVCLECVYDPHAWSQEILAAGLLSSNGPDGLPHVLDRPQAGQQGFPVRMALLGP